MAYPGVPWGSVGRGSWSWGLVMCSFHDVYNVTMLLHLRFNMKQWARHWNDMALEAAKTWSMIATAWILHNARPSCPQFYNTSHQGSLLMVCLGKCLVGKVASTMRLP